MRLGSTAGLQDGDYTSTAKARSFVMPEYTYKTALAIDFYYHLFTWIIKGVRSKTEALSFPDRNDLEGSRTIESSNF